MASIVPWRDVDTLRPTPDVLARIEATHSRTAPGVLHLGVLLPDGTVDTLTGTEEHPFWVPDQGAWVPLAKLETGTVLRTSSGGDAVVLGMEAVPGFTDVFNFEIAGVHNYFVRGAEGDGPGVLVHNGCGQEVREQVADAMGGNAGQFGRCVECADAAQGALQDAGVSGTRVRIESEGPIGFDMPDGSTTRLENNGVHEFVEAGGTTFDNMNPTGMATEEFNERLVTSPGAATSVTRTEF